MNIEQIPVKYKMSILKPQDHYVDVELELRNLDTPIVEMKMPSWLPGAYKLNEFARNVEEFYVYDADGRQIAWHKKDKLTWLIECKGCESIRVTYRVYCFELEDDASYVCENFALINPGVVLMAVTMYMDTPYQLELVNAEQWKKISTGMKKIDGVEKTFIAKDYHELLDCPMLIGNHRIETFHVNDIEHEVAIEGRGNLDVDEFVADLEKITRVEIKMMRHVPYERYVYFLLLTNKDAGLEHRNSTMIFVKRFDFKPRVKYLETLSIFSHELFHVWNVKALRPKPLLIPTYFKEDYTGLLWFSEGFTNYYHNAFMFRAGIISCKEFLSNIAKAIFRYRRTPGIHYQSAYESSWDTWIKYYIRSENTRNSVISYYLKGSLIALILDLAILKDSEAEYNLDDVVRDLYKKCYLDNEIGFDYDDVKDSVAKFTKTNFGKLLDELVHCRGDMPFEEYLKLVGLKLEPKDTSNGDENNKTIPGFLGVMLAEKDHRVWINTVERNGPALKGGLQAEDEIVAIDGFRVVSKSEVEERLEMLPPETRVEFTVSRRGEMRIFDTVLGEALPKGFELTVDPDADKAARELFDRWTDSRFQDLLDETKPEKSERKDHKVEYVSYETGARAPHAEATEETPKPV